MGAKIINQFDGSRHAIGNLLVFCTDEINRFLNVISISKQQRLNLMSV
jgi:hypothetical protein